MIIAIFGLAPPRLMHAAVASEPTTETAEGQLCRLEIPKTTLSAALKDLAQQTSLQFARFSDVAPTTVIVGPLSGTYTRAQALDLLLRGTGLTYRFVNERTVAIVAIVTNAPSSGKHSTLPPPLIKSSPQSAAPSVAPAAPESNRKPQEQKSVSKKKGLLGRIAGFFALCGPLIAAGPSYCQNAAPDTSTDALQEVVVTAERRSTNLQTTPISIVAISGEQLAATQITDINGLNQITPNLVIYNSGATQTADIRGIGNSNQGGVEEVGVLVVKDGLPNQSEGSGVNVPNFDITDIEVLRGPQGTFAGDNSTGGAIIMNSQNPNFRGTNGYVDLDIATYSEQKIQGAINLPVSDTLAMRLAFNEETQGSFFHDEYTEINGPYESGPYLCPGAYPCVGVTTIGGTFPSTGQSETVKDPGNVNDRDARLGLLWKPTDALQSLTKLEIDHDDSDGIPAQPDMYTFSPLAPGLPCPANHGTAPNCTSTYAPYYSGSPYLLNDAESQLETYQSNVDQFSEQLQYTLPSGIALRVIGGDQEIDTVTAGSVTDTRLNYGFSNETQPTHIYTGEFDAISPTTGRFSWIVGANKLYESAEYAGYAINTGPPYSVAAPSIRFWTNGNTALQKSEGVFGQVSWQFTQTLQLVAGARMGWDSEVAAGALDTFRTNETPIANAVTPTNGSPSDRVPTGKVDLNWTPLPGQFFYAFAARGYKPGEVNLGLEPYAHYEWVNDYELGWKGRLADGHVLMQLGGYYMQYMDMLEDIFNPKVASSTNVDNIPYSNIKGIEFSMQSQLAHVGLNIGAAYNKSILGPLVTAATYKFPLGYGVTNQCAPGEVPNATLSNCTNYTPFLVHLSGGSLPYAPAYTADVSLQYTIPVDSMSVVPRVSYAYQSKSYSSIFQSDNYYLLPAHGLLGAYLDWNAGPWTTTIYATNLANTVYLEGTGLYGNPRQMGVEVHRAF